MFQVICFLSVAGLGLSVAASGLTPYLLVVGSLLLGALVYWLMRVAQARKGVDVRFAFSNVPVE